MHIPHTHSHTHTHSPTLCTLPIKSKTHFAAPKNQTTPKSMQHPNPQAADEVVFVLVMGGSFGWVVQNCSYRA